MAEDEDGQELLDSRSGTQDDADFKTVIVSSRIPYNLKIEIEKLTTEYSVSLSVLIRDLLEETVACGRPRWWLDEAEKKVPEIFE